MYLDEFDNALNDFKKLDYSSMYSLNIACSQELYKIIQQQQSVIETFGHAMQQLKTEIDEIKAKMN